MAELGHSPRSNLDRREAVEAVHLELASPKLTNRISLPYYEQPKALEKMIIQEAHAAEEIQGVHLPDVSVASFGDTAMLEVVIGFDDRVKVAQPYMAQNPWRQICALIIRSQSGRSYVGTAWFIGPKTLATAGHCVYLQDDGGWAKEIDVIPARFGRKQPFGKLHATRFAAVDGWTVLKQRDFDYGVIHLDDATVGQKVGNFAVEALPESRLLGSNAKISGYPADREQAQFQYFHERLFKSLSPTRVEYEIDTYGGQSGSPIWQETQEFGLIAVGIHTNGGVSSNSGTRITQSVLDNLIGWMEE